MTPRLNLRTRLGAMGDACSRKSVARGDQVEARDIANAQLAWRHGDTIVTLWATNLTDQHYVAAINSGLRFAGPPRQFGVRVFRAF